jgi:hypothetical protein
MIRNTFIHIPGIGRKLERQLWRRGILSWEDFLEQKGEVLSPARDLFVRAEIERSLAHAEDIRFFNERLTNAERWRLFDTFRHTSAFLDIETTGGYGGEDAITVIGLYDGCKTQSFVWGRNLQDFEISVADYDLLVTFNGSCFDLPHIRRWFRGITLPPAHIDLRWVLRRLRLPGGLKKVEKVLGITRPPEVDGLTGYDAVVLWREYQWGDEAALERLIRYNRADIESLEPIAVWACNEMKRHIMDEGTP